MNDNIIDNKNSEKEKFIIEVKDSTNSINKIEIVKILPSKKEFKLYAIYKVLEDNYSNNDFVTLDIAIWDENEKGIKLKEIVDTNEYKYALTLLTKYLNKEED